MHKNLLPLCVLAACDISLVALVARCWFFFAVMLTEFTCCSVSKTTAVLHLPQWPYLEQEEMEMLQLS